MRCHSLGDIAVSDTIKVGPNDILTFVFCDHGFFCSVVLTTHSRFEWHHRTRSDSDQVIDPSHRGAAAVYISPNPPRDNTWVSDSSPFYQVMNSHVDRSRSRRREKVQKGHGISQGSTRNGRGSK